MGLSFKYISVFSGIEAATVAWKPLGWTPLWFSEIAQFPRELLGYRYPMISNYGSVNNYKRWPDARPDLIVGGSPCQSFSVAGLGKGLADPRGNLTLVYLAIIERYRPQWVVWENVPGVLLSDEGRAFGSILGGLAQLGYGFAYRILDAQYVRVESYPRALPQRRRRVFVVGYLRDWRRPAAVLLEQEGLLGRVNPRGETQRHIAPALTGGPPFSRTGNERVEADAIVARTLRSHHNTTLQEDVDTFVTDQERPRRLTPRECERLQGFPDDYTLIPYNGKPASRCPDGPRYRALGNSMACNVMQWIGQRIQMVEEIGHGD